MGVCSKTAQDSGNVIEEWLDMIVIRMYGEGDAGIFGGGRSTMNPLLGDPT